VIPVPFRDLSDDRLSETSAVIRARVMEARAIQENRFSDLPGIHCNAQMSARIHRKYCRIDETGHNILKNAMEKLGLSARAFDRILKVSRTIADLAKSENILAEHLAEAINFRSLDRDSWGR
jgi:magnesium chelatase family protein